jgi:CheY-like chemotaxis protein
MKKKIIWIVDDDLIYQIICNKIIQKSNMFSGYCSFLNGKEAITALKKSLENEETLPDIILLDINMPIMDGWEFMEEMNILKPRISKKITTYIVTSSISFEDKNKSKKFTDILGYFSKPFTVNDLIAITSNE